jgi:hypothetical protein
MSSVEILKAAKETLARERAESREAKAIAQVHRLFWKLWTHPATAQRFKDLLEQALEQYNREWDEQNPGAFDHMKDQPCRFTQRAAFLDREAERRGFAGDVRVVDIRRWRHEKGGRK